MMDSSEDRGDPDPRGGLADQERRLSTPVLPSSPLVRLLSYSGDVPSEEPEETAVGATVSDVTPTAFINKSFHGFIPFDKNTPVPSEEPEETAVGATVSDVTPMAFVNKSYHGFTANSGKKAVAASNFVSDAIVVVFLNNHNTSSENATFEFPMNETFFEAMKICANKSKNEFQQEFESATASEEEAEDSMDEILKGETETGEGEEEWYAVMEGSTIYDFRYRTTRKRRQEAEDGKYHDVVQQFLQGEGIGPRRSQGRPYRIPFSDAKRADDEDRLPFLPGYVVYHDTTRILAELFHPTEVDEEVQFVQIDMDTLVGSSNACIDPATATIGSRIAIYGLKRRHQGRMKKNRHSLPQYRVTAFSVILTSTLTPSVIAVLRRVTDFRAYDVIGSKCPNSMYLEERTVRGKLRVGGFADVEAYSIPPCFIEERINGNSMFLFDFEEMNRYYQGFGPTPGNQRSEEQWRFTNIRPIKKTRKRELASFHNVANGSDLSLVTRDTKEYFEAAFLAEHKRNYEDLFSGCATGTIQDFTDRNNMLEIGVIFDFDDGQKLFAEESLFRWKLGDRIIVETDEFDPDHGYAPVFTITSYVKMPSGATVFMELTGEEYRMYKLMGGNEDVLAECMYYRRNVEFQPCFPNEDMRCRALQEGFDVLQGQGTMMIDRLCGLGTSASGNTERHPIVAHRKVILDEGQENVLREIDDHRNACVVVDGPVGSGKTQLVTAIVLANAEDNVMRKQLSVPATRILLVADTEEELDNILNRIWETDATIRISRMQSEKRRRTTSRRNQQMALEFQCWNAELFIGEWTSSANGLLPASFTHKKEAIQKATEKLRTLGRTSDEERIRLFEEVLATKKELEWDFLQHYQPEVVAMTLETAIETREIGADILLLDDASRLTIGSAFALLSRWPHIAKIVALGDLKQALQPELSRQFATVARTSAFQRWSSSSVWKTLSLKKIFRFHSSIFKHLIAPSYPSLTGVVPETAWSLAAAMNLPLARGEYQVPILMVHVERNRRADSTAVSGAINKDEASTCLRILDHCTNRGINPSSIAIVCFQIAQKEFLKGNVDELYGGAVAVDMIDWARGQEFDVVIISTSEATKSDHSTYKNIVAVSKAREAEYIVGNWETLCQTDFWRQRFTELLSEGALVDQWLWPLDMLPVTPAGNGHALDCRSRLRTKRHSKGTHNPYGFKWRRF